MRSKQECWKAVLNFALSNGFVFGICNLLREIYYGNKITCEEYHLLKDEMDKILDNKLGEGKKGYLFELNREGNKKRFDLLEKLSKPTENV